MELGVSQLHGSALRAVVLFRDVGGVEEFGRAYWALRTADTGYTCNM